MERGRAGGGGGGGRVDPSSVAAWLAHCRRRESGGDWYQCGVECAPFERARVRLVEERKRVLQVRRLVCDDRTQQRARLCTKHAAGGDVARGGWVEGVGRSSNERALRSLDG